MADYITKESVHTMIRHLTKFAWRSPTWDERRVTVDTDDIHFGVDKIPAADVTPVVRCRGCKHWDDDPDTYGTDDGPKGKCMKSFETMHADDFCSYGERKDGGG